MLGFADLRQLQPIIRLQNSNLWLRVDSGALLQTRLVLQRRFVFDAIIPGDPADQFAASPICKDAIDVFSCDPGHGG